MLELCQRCDDATLASLLAGPLSPWLTAPPEDATPEALLLALRLWPRLPPAAAAACPLLPAGCKAKLPAALFADPAAAASSKAVAAAAAAFFSRDHLAALLPVLRATTQAHPRLHTLWPTLLALLIPGFSADKVGPGLGSQGAGRYRQILSTAGVCAMALTGERHGKKQGSPLWGSRRWAVVQAFLGGGSPILPALLHGPVPSRLCTAYPPMLQEQRGAGGVRDARPSGPALEAFWSTVVDGDLVQSSHERKYLAFTLFLLLLPHLG